jgi:hypothetical protein
MGQQISGRVLMKERGKKSADFSEESARWSMIL